MGPTYERVWKETDPDFPRPIETEEDAKGWVPAGTSKDYVRGPGRASIVVDLDETQTAWVRAAAKAAGLDYVSFLLRLVDQARQADQQADHDHLDQADQTEVPHATPPRKK